MLPEHIILQSSGSLAVAVMALLMTIVQGAFVFKQKRIYLVCLVRGLFIFSPALCRGYFFGV